MSQLVRLEGEHTTQRAHCALQQTSKLWPLKERQVKPCHLSWRWQLLETCHLVPDHNGQLDLLWQTPLEHLKNLRGQLGIGLEGESEETFLCLSLFYWGCVITEPVIFCQLFSHYTKGRGFNTSINPYERIQSLPYSPKKYCGLWSLELPSQGGILLTWLETRIDSALICPG